MKAAVLVSLARQVEGEYVHFRVIKAHENPEKLKKFLSDNLLPQTAVIGGVDCVIEYGVIENIEIETD